MSNRFQLVISLAFMVPAWALLGGFAALDSPGPGGVIGGMAVGAVVGVLFGLAFGGAKGKWVDYIFGQEQPEAEGDPARDEVVDARSDRS